MTRKAHGILRKNTVILDEVLPEMEGCRVTVELRLAPEEETRPPAELQEAWAAWAASGNQGPILDEPDEWT